MKSIYRESDQVPEKMNFEKQIAHYSGFFQNDITLRTFIESLPAGVILINVDGIIIHMNSRISEMFDYSKDEVIGKHLNLFIPARSHEIHQKHLAEYFRQPKIRPMGMGLELIFVKKDKSEIPVEVSLSYLNSELGQFGIAFITDISTRKKAENELQDLIKELDSFAHTVAHDLTSILSMVIGYSNLLIYKPDLTDEKKVQFLDIIDQSANKMNKIIHELLLLATLKKDEVEYSTINMDENVREAIKRFDSIIIEKSAIIKIPDHLIPAIGYAQWIEEVWYNYFSNALKYGGKPPLIEVGCEEAENNYIKYWVKDNGEGILPEDLENIFKSTEEVKVKRIDGLGLGLPIVDRIMKKLNGYVEVESEFGKGSTFSFYLHRKQ